MANLLRKGLKYSKSVKILFNSACVTNKGIHLIQCRNSKPTIRYEHFSRGRCFHTCAVLNKIVPYKLTDIGEGIREVHVKEWFIKVGDRISQFDNICEVQSDKASVTITSRYDGVVTKLYHKVDDVALVGHPLVDIDVQEDGEQGDNQETSSSSSDSSSSDDENHGKDNNKAKALATPAVRRLAMQNNLDLANITASGKGGRVLKEDILKYLNISSEDSNDVKIMKKANDSVTSAAKPKVQSKPIPAQLEEDRVVAITGFTRAMVKTMTESLKIPHFVYSDEIDVTQLMEIRAKTKQAAADAGVNLTFMPFFIKAASLALFKYPILNSSIDESVENITYKSSHNIGVAMDTPNGLIVPNIKNVQHKTILQIGAELNRLQQDGMKGTLKADDLVGGTFSLSNIGIIGGTYTKPVILAPQVSIGALGKIQALPRFDKDGNITKVHILCVSWAADHRIIDGVTMANFSNKWKHYVENPSHLMLDL